MAETNWYTQPFRLAGQSGGLTPFASNVPGFGFSKQDYSKAKSSEEDATDSVGATKGELSAIVDRLLEENTPEALAAKAEVQRQFQLNMMRDAAPYKLMFETPKMLMESISRPALMQLAGSSRIADAIGQGYGNIRFDGFNTAPIGQVATGYFR